VWNELIMQLRAHNEDHALLCQRLKQFVQALFAQLPELAVRFESEVISLREAVADRN
jgi:hypothetical protein